MTELGAQPTDEELGRLLFRAEVEEHIRGILDPSPWLLQECLKAAADESSAPAVRRAKLAVCAELLSELGQGIDQVVLESLLTKSVVRAVVLATCRG